jgi:predicted ATPase/DNA-binding winged helix-turn-helix (wHTH) protein
MTSTAVEYRFGHFVLKPAVRRLYADGEPVPIGGRALDLLTVLVEQRERAVERDELIERVWPGRVVAEENLKVQVLALRKLLGPAAIVTVPRVGYRFGLELLDATQPSAAAPPKPSSPWGTAPRLWGRDGDIAAVLDALKAHRLVTLAGSGGLGKTRVAQAVAARAARDFPDGVAMVDLAALADPGDVPSTLARSLELPGDASGAGPGSIAAALRALQVLVVLDNCEHLLAAVADVATQVTGAAPGVRLLATSQEPLAVRGERVLRLAPLGTPPAGAPPDPQAAGSHPAVALFVERVQGADPAFALDDANVGAVCEVCRRLDGVPLALELAAARVPLLGVAGVLARLDRPLQLLSARAPLPGGRHQGMRDALAWSHALLAPAEQAAFRRLGIFVGTFSLESARVVAAEGDDDWAVIEQLSTLVDKSLLHAVDAGNHKRYRMLEAARAYAHEQLEAAGETAPILRRHAQAMVAVYERADATYSSTPMLEWEARWMPDLGNLRAAMAWALSAAGDAELAVALAGASASFLLAAGLQTEARRYLLAAAERLDDAMPLPRRAQFWLATALRGALDATMPPAEALAAAERALALCRELGDGPRLYRSLVLYLQEGQRTQAPLDYVGLLAQARSLESPGWSALQSLGRRNVVAKQLWQTSDWEAYSRSCQAELALMREAGDERRTWMATHNVALSEILLGRPEEAAALMEPVVDTLRARGLARRCWPQVGILAAARVAAGEPARAADAVREAVGALQVASTLWWLGDQLAWWLAQCGDVAGAARVLGWSDARHATLGMPRGPTERATLASLEPVLTSALPRDVLAAEREAGARLTDDEVAGFVLAAVARMGH